jgi:uncharacterized cupin superfamily protein
MTPKRIRVEDWSTSSHAGTREDTPMDSVKIIDVSAKTPAGLAARPVEDQPYWTVTEGDRPTYGSRDDFLSADRRLHVGYSQFEKMTLQLKNWPVDEFMHFLEGQVEITDESGASKVYGPGDMLVMPKGFNGTWRQLSPIKKISVYYGSLE